MASNPTTPLSGPKRLAELMREAMRSAPPRRTPEERAALELQRKAEEAEAAKRHLALEAERWPLHLRHCGAPPEAVSVLAAGAPRYTPALRAAEDFLHGSKRFLVLGGGTGAGKTLAACWCLKAALRRETRTGYGFLEYDSDAGLFLRLFRLTRLSDFDMPDRLLFRRACDARVLVLDEVQRARPGEELTPRGQEWLDEVLDARDAAHKRTVLTTNLSVRHDAPDEKRLARFVGDRAASRIARSCQVQDCGTADLRREVKP